MDVLCSTRRSVLITKTLQNDTSFLIAHFIKEYINLGLPVFLVTVDNDRHHFINVLKKLGVAFNMVQDCRSLFILDWLSLGKQSDDESSNHFSLEDLYKKVHESVKQWMSEGKEFVFVIESLTTLFTLAEDRETILNFCQYCLLLGQTTIGHQSSFITTFAADIDPSTSALLVSLFDAVIYPKPMNLISIANVDGAVILKWNRIPSIQQALFSTELYYRVRDSAISFFPYVDLNL